MNVMLMVDEDMERYMSPLAPSNGLTTLRQEVLSTSRNISIPGPVISNIANWMQYVNEESAMDEGFIKLMEV